jgi:hypothetical protein
VASRNTSLLGKRREKGQAGVVDAVLASQEVLDRSGRSVQGRMWLCIWFTLPNEPRIFPTLRRKLPGREVKVMNPSSRRPRRGPKVRKKSARA